MAVFQYKKYKISLSPNASKLQGLRVGDIVRRQYFDNQLEKTVTHDSDGNVTSETYTGKNVGSIYNLMCVLEVGEDLVEQLLEDGTPVVDEDGNPVKFKQQWFIGALLEGVDTPPKAGEILDFVRITNLFDTNRSGVLYLTASDDTSPFMDVIDGIGRNESLCWPEGLCSNEEPDSEKEYCLFGDAQGDYLSNDDAEHNRILHIKRHDYGDGFIALKQDFFKYVSNPNMVLVSFKARANRNIGADLTLGYTNEARTDTESPIKIDLGENWNYYFKAITVDWSGRHLRTLKLDLSSMQDGDEVWVSDFNIILLSSVSNFQEASKTRIGRLDGVIDPVFGKLDGYGGYLQKLFASQSAHISGTLTAGDENGFGSSFYAGKIHKNVLINSLGINTTHPRITDSSMPSPTKVGDIINISSNISIIAQTNEWLTQRFGDTYTFSFWGYTKKPCIIELLQNDKAIGTLYLNVLQTHQWVRLSKTFDLRSLDISNANDDLILTVKVIFKDIEDEIFGDDFKNDDGNDEPNSFLFTSPQLESGKLVTQYQPTDEVLNYTEDYGAWFDRGGIGGTIQNPLLRLNYDGKGGIATKPTGPNNEPSLALNQDGSGHLAQGNIQWDKNGDVTFGKGVHLTWENLSEDTHEQLTSRSIKIYATSDTFAISEDVNGDLGSVPQEILLSIKANNIDTDSCIILWQYLNGQEWVNFPDNINGNETLTVAPICEDGDYWGDSKLLNIKCSVFYNGEEYLDTFTIRKLFLDGYVIDITSSNGVWFKNNECATILNADVYYQGELLSPEYVREHFVLKWTKYDIVDGELIVDEEFWGEPGDEKYIDRNAQTIVLDYALSGSDYFTCELLQFESGFPYNFTIEF